MSTRALASLIMAVVILFGSFCVHHFTFCVLNIVLYDKEENVGEK